LLSKGKMGNYRPQIKTVRPDRQGSFSAASIARDVNFSAEASGAIPF
jgi:hypothetical protein